MRLRTTLLAGLVGLALVAAGCGGDDDDDAAGGGDAGVTEACGEIAVDPVEGFEPVKAGTLTIVTSLPGPGFWTGDSPENITAGFEYCMAQAMRQAFGLDNLEIRNENFDAIVTGAVKDYDLALSQVTITEERAKVVDFSDPYFESQQGILVKAGTEITTLEQAKAALFGVQTGTTGEILVRERLKPTQEPQAFQDLAAAFTALQAGQVDAVVMDTAIVLGQAAESNGEQEVVAQFEQPDGPDQYGAVLPKGSPNVDEINAALRQLKDKGLLAQFGQKNLTADPGNIPVITLD